MGRIGKLAAAVGALAVLGAGHARADVYHVDYSGTLSSGADLTGVFGNTGSLVGAAFTLEYVFSLSKSGANEASAMYDRGSVNPDPGVNYLFADLKINGQDYYFDPNASYFLSAQSEQVSDDRNFAGYSNNMIEAVNDSKGTALGDTFAHALGSGSFVIDFTPDDSHEDPRQYAFGSFTGSHVVAADVSSAPEPAAWALMVGGVAVAGSALRRRRLQVARA